MPNTFAAISTDSAGPNPASSIQKSQSGEQRNQFLQLLVAQLKGQNPLNPLDGTQFVSQLAQFSSLEELANVRSEIQGFRVDFRTAQEEQKKAKEAGAADGAVANPFLTGTAASTQGA